MKPQILLLCVGILCISSGRGQQTDKLIIHFDFNQSNINAESRRQLDSMLLSNRNVFSLSGFVIDAHCDSIGNNRYNDSLSLERAKSVKNFLIVAGFTDTAFAQISGHGKRQPLNDNMNPDERFLNRRVELLIRKSPLVVSEPIPQKKISDVINDTATKVGSKIILRNLNFEGGRHILLERSIPVLNELLEAMQKNPALKIEIHGHVCCTANYLDGRDNDLGTFDLSWQRAKVVYQFLLDRNISADRMSYRGFGASQKLYPYERDAYEQEENRRVEIKIVSK